MSSDDAAADMNSEVFAQCKGGSEEPCSKRLTVALPRKISTSQISMLTKSVAQLYTLIAQQAKADQLVSRRCSTCPTNTKQSILDTDLSFPMGQRRSVCTSTTDWSTRHRLYAALHDPT
jgi:hypothetical protein